jgi:hypothetical protein
MVNVVEVIVVVNAVVQFFVADHNHNQSKTDQIKSNQISTIMNSTILS